MRDAWSPAGAPARQPASLPACQLLLLSAYPPRQQRAQRIADNLRAADADWALPAESMAELDGLECDFRYFISYRKRPDNDLKWHDGVIETGTDADYVTTGAGSCEGGS